MCECLGDACFMTQGVRPMGQAGQGTALVVDDERPIRRLLRNWLRGAGWQVREAASVEEALKVAAAESIQLLVTDQVMPGDLDGATLARRLQTLDQHKAVVIVTGRATVELREEFCVLEKPFTEPGLRHSVEAARVRAAGGAAAGPNPSPA